jgi:hypothetical protein
MVFVTFRHLNVVLVDKAISDPLWLTPEAVLS